LVKPSVFSLGSARIFEEPEEEEREDRRQGPNRSSVDQRRRRPYDRESSQGHRYQKDGEGYRSSRRQNEKPENSSEPNDRPRSASRGGDHKGTYSRKRDQDAPKEDAKPHKDEHDKGHVRREDNHREHKAGDKESYRPRKDEDGYRDRGYNGSRRSDYNSGSRWRDQRSSSQRRYRDDYRSNGNYSSHSNHDGPRGGPAVYYRKKSTDGTEKQEKEVSGAPSYKPRSDYGRERSGSRRGTKINYDNHIEKSGYKDRGYSDKRDSDSYKGKRVSGSTYSAGQKYHSKPEKDQEEGKNDKKDDHKKRDPERKQGEGKYEGSWNSRSHQESQGRGPKSHLQYDSHRAREKEFDLDDFPRLK
jgi:hypothetical protein